MDAKTMTNDAAPYQKHDRRSKRSARGQAKVPCCLRLTPEAIAIAEAKAAALHTTKSELVERLLRQQIAMSWPSTPLTLETGRGDIALSSLSISLSDISMEIKRLADTSRYNQ